MTPNEYRALARLINRTRHAMRREPGSALTLDELVRRAVDHFQTYDPEHFDSAKFLHHCGLTPTEEPHEGATRPTA